MSSIKKISLPALFNLFVFTGACFLLLNLPAFANTKPAPTPKGAAAPQKPTPPKTDTGKIIVSVTSARVRAAATTGSAEVRKLKLGTVLSVIEKTTGTAFWYKVQLPAGSKPATGWMSSTVVDSFDQAKSETTYRQLTTKNFKKEGMAYDHAVEVYEFLARVAPDVKNRTIAAELNLRKYQALASVLALIPIERSNSQPYKGFTDKNDGNIVYSDPAGQFFIRADHLWDLNKKYADTVYGEETAWTAARTFLPGECEGYINCYLYVIKITDGEYLTRYPDSKNAVEALKNISAFLDPIVDDLKEKKVYTGPSDISDRAEYNQHLTDLRAIISRLPLVEKDKPLRQIVLLGEAYR